MEDKKYKKNAIKIIILFILAFIFIMFLPELRTTIKIKNYEKKQQIKLEQKKEEEEQKEKKNTLDTMICSPKTDTEPGFNIAYNKNGLQKYTRIDSEETKTENLPEECTKEDNVIKGIEIKCEINNGTLIKSTTYDFKKINEQDRKDNIFDFKYNESISKIRKELESKEYTCG